MVGRLHVRKVRKIDVGAYCYYRKEGMSPGIGKAPSGKHPPTNRLLTKASHYCTVTESITGLSASSAANGQEFGSEDGGDIGLEVP